MDMEDDSGSIPARHASTSTTMTVSSEAGPSTPTLSHRHEVHPAVVRDSSTTPSPVMQTSGEEGFVRGPPTPGVRLSRMMMGKMGSLPPPPGPPPLGPPPLPPAPTPSFADANQPQSQVVPPIPGSGSRTSSLPSSTHSAQSSRVSMIHTNPSRPPPAAPPPTSALPPIPSGSSSSHRRQISMSSSISSSGSGPRRRSTKGKAPSLNGRSSPSISSLSGHAPPPISPRTSSLNPPAQAQASSSRYTDATNGQSTPISKSSSQTSLVSRSPGQSSHPLPSQTGQGEVAIATVPDAKRSSNPRHPRTPSRHLLQSALDLAQQAVQMDKRNDVQGSLAAYREAVTRLKSVMERVGVDPPVDGKRRTSSGKSEEEGRTLRGIHDAYVARIELLSSYSGPNGETRPRPDSRQSSHGRQDSSNSGPSRGGGDVTPTRSSLDESAHAGIGNLMLSDPAPNASSFTTPDRHQAGPLTPTRAAPPSPTPPSRNLPRPPSPTPRGINIDIPIGEAEGEGVGLSMQQALDNAAESARTSLDGEPSSRHQSQLGLGHPSTSPRTVVQASASTAFANEAAAELTPSKKREMLRRKMMSGNMEFLEQTLGGDDIPSSSRGHSRQGSAASSNLHPIGIGRGPSISSESGSKVSEDKGLPPLPHSAPMYGTNNHTNVAGSSSGSPYASSPRQSSMSTLMHPRADGLLVSPSTNSGRIAQRRISRQMGQTSISSMTEIGSASGSGPGLRSNTGSIIFPSQGHGQGHGQGQNQSQGYAQPGSHLSPGSFTTTPTGAGRTRAKSQPGTRPDLFHNASESRTPPPPLPAIPPKTSAQFIKRAPSHSNANRLAPPHAVSASMSMAMSGSGSASVSSPHSVTRSISSSLISPVPEPQPSETSHRPFHLIRVLQASMDPHGSGAYLTGSIHVSPVVWHASLHTRPGQKKDPLRLVAQDVKVRCMEALIINLEIVRATGIPLLDGPRELKYGAPLSHIPHPRGGESVVKMAEDFSHALDALEDEMDQTYKLMVKAGAQVNGWKGKKSNLNTKSWGSRFTRSMDKITHTKALDSSDKYVELLSHFCASIQAIDDHLLNFTGPCSPAYHYLPPRARSAIESRIMKAAEFASAVVVPFMLDDFKQFFSRYLKGGVKYLED